MELRTTGEKKETLPPTPSPGTRVAGGLDRFRSLLHPAVVSDVGGWAADPELGKLYASLQAINDREKFFNTYAEALIARRLLDRGCDLRVEVLTPSGRSCDFEVTRGDQRFYLHVKRLYSDRPTHKSLAIPSRLRYLERIARPYVVSVHLGEDATDDHVRRYVKAAAEFIKRGRVGDELVVRDADGGQIGSCRLVAPWEGTHVSLVIGLPSGFIDEAPRIRRLLRKAYRQFMPGRTNVILIGSSQAQDLAEFETALLGTHIERWDASPPTGMRVAHGRDTDGFWHEGLHSESGAAGWFRFNPRAETLRCRLWIRNESALPEGMGVLLADLLGGRGIK